MSRTAKLGEFLEALNNDKTTASGTLNLLYATGTALPAETGLRISSRGLITFASGQTFPGTGPVTSVGLSAPASDFTVSGSPVKTAGTLNFAWNVAPTSADTANAIVKRDGSGNFTAGAITANALNAADVALTDTLSLLSSEVTPLNASSGNPGAKTILGGATATSGEARGVEGFTESNSSSAYGVVGEAIASSGNPIGVYGLTLNSPNAIGVFGQNGLESTTGTNLISSGVIRRRRRLGRRWLRVNHRQLGSHRHGGRWGRRNLRKQRFQLLHPICVQLR